MDCTHTSVVSDVGHEVRGGGSNVQDGTCADEGVMDGEDCHHLVRINRLDRIDFSSSSLTNSPVDKVSGFSPEAVVDVGASSFMDRTNVFFVTFHVDSDSLFITLQR